MKKEKKIAHFKSILPSRIQVRVIKDDVGVWARILDLPRLAQVFSTCVSDIVSVFHLRNLALPRLVK